MRVLLTGGCGYVGSNTFFSLINSRFEPVILDNLERSVPGVLNRLSLLSKKDVEFYRVDLRDQKKLSCLFSEVKVDAVIHFAGYKDVTESTLEPTKYYANNVGGLVNLLNCMNSAGCKTLIFSSSASVYGNHEGNLAIEESAPLNPRNPYARTKVLCEQILNDLKRNDPTWRIGIFRYFNPVGAGGIATLGELISDRSTNIFPRLLRVAAGVEKYFVIHGQDYDTPDGTAIRDYIHIEDLANGHVKGLKFLLATEEVNAFFELNLGTGIGISVRQLIETFERENSVRINVQVGERRTTDIGVSFTDVTRTKEILNWSPTRDLESSCRNSWTYYSEMINRMSNIDD